MRDSSSRRCEADGESKDGGPDCQEFGPAIARQVISCRSRLHAERGRNSCALRARCSPDRPKRASPVTSSPAVAKGKVVVATADGQVICFG